MTHAFFKALLFLAAGSVIHGLGGEQDMRHMGGLRKYLPYTFWCMTIATFAIAGLPPFAGFFSKDRILWSAWSSGYHVLVADRRDHRRHDLVLHVPAVVPDFLWRVSRAES